MTIPENFIRLHEGEETLRAESIRRIDASATLPAHLTMVESSMDLLNFVVHDGEPFDEDDLTIRLLGIRLFNAFASVVKLTLSGYYQTATLQLRDTIETAFLLDYFTSDRALITEWRTASEQVRKRKFQPAVVRRNLDTRDNFTGKKRDQAYDRFCGLAAHANPNGFEMVRPVRGGGAHLGPFLEDGALDAVISETALCAVQAAGSIRRLTKARGMESLEAKLLFMEHESDWLERFFSVQVDRKALSEIRAKIQAARKFGMTKPDENST